MKIPKKECCSYIWADVYRDTINDELDDDENVWYSEQHRKEYPCISILIPERVMEVYLKNNGMSWKFFGNEAMTYHFDGLYEFAKDDIVAWNYSI